MSFVVYARARNGEHNNVASVLSAAHPVSARKIKLRSAACRAAACLAPLDHHCIAVMLLNAICCLLTSQSSLPSQVILAKADVRDDAILHSRPGMTTRARTTGSRRTSRWCGCRAVQQRTRRHA